MIDVSKRSPGRAWDALRGKAEALRRSVAGVAAVEFALVLPVMVAMLLGMSEVTLGVNIDRKLTLLSRSLADLTSRPKSLTPAKLDEFFKAASVIMQPFDAAQMKMTVTSMKVTKVGSNFNGTVDWSCARGSGAATKPKNVNYPVPSGFQTDGSYYILVDVSLPYTPMFGKAISGTINLSESTPWPVRNNTRVELPSGCPSST
ncbi:TadE/TadG family type IV pilus assembly protein [Enterovirga sp. CN4-39]|uniref:TadE/TadG family type IV pilus assembly protein n=1 Tax=Enterovirga sp. CN4-39 TaxID=3400910 RepID=UPI003C0FF0C5